MNKQKLLILSVFGSVILVMFFYIVLHESGHCLVAIFCGARITEFSILGAHMSYEGGTFNSITLPLLNAAGMLMPVIVSGAYIAFYSNKRDSIFYRIYSFMFALIPFFSLIAWIFVPILYMRGTAPAADDVTQFINNSGLNPWIVCLTAGIMLFCGVFFAWKKRILQNYWEACRGVRSGK